MYLKLRYFQNLSCDAIAEQCRAKTAAAVDRAVRRAKKTLLEHDFSFDDERNQKKAVTNSNH